ncbi:MAG: Type 1 glutamine amidotransferase-like domain-containing protein [Candidatus Sungbacteria bacterium]|uniref:Type 1 glutamine amidotransferase-like domain-containing protein n=1 Tax=Candidatus Sungiibacteriota bacterium TaxID=2750080 RepID=A0A932QY83_9BACT|nr:Type 1 glutamine amidotransferase-like domain-containing protein [Candidatus Sungbacteria bacterium]
MLGTLILTSRGLSDVFVRDLVRTRVDFPARVSVAMITTAAQEKEKSPYARSDRRRLDEMGFSRIDFFDVEKEVASGLRRYDIIYVSGGNTFYLLHHLRRSGADAVLKDMLENRPVLYIGVSAGSIVVGKSIASSADENLVGLQDLTGLQLLEEVIIPHFGDHKKAIYERMIARGYRAVCLRDGQALIVEHGGQIIIG